MMGYLWLHREKPALFSRRWVVVWGKRLLTIHGLAGIYFKRWHLILAGTAVGELSTPFGLTINGSKKKVEIGAHTFIGRRVIFASHAAIRIGSFTCINDDVRLLSGSHDISDPGWRMRSSPIIIGDYAWIAAGVTILPGVSVGKGAVIGAGSVVTKDVPDYATAVGNPASTRLDRRCRTFNYDPVLFAAPIEAWVGPIADDKHAVCSEALKKDR